ncbi:hypothetical protein [Aneurinibacillus aneurinilyticus]|uniref:Uncharacterized protein n=1 Tax=Aneurinibacillus aneurinilyticus ATCC 12856 TaxID=649747 RepID=U1WQH5_ANEAE|nr:hypothetical protein [Aneurinibacillus aneurinilyticus]ERI10839.1 hypothetical protein HMPREF0083_01095 [Aneurinibacillus aneurinilyticus ATCC 12856]
MRNKLARLFLSVALFILKGGDTMFPRIAVIYVTFIIDEEISYIDVPATLKVEVKRQLELLGCGHLVTEAA